jgi:hypothetical protein
MHQPGFEPGSSAWKAPILTTRLLMRLRPLSLKISFLGQDKTDTAAHLQILNVFSLHFFQQIISELPIDIEIITRYQ